MNPTSPTYKKFIKFLEKLPKDQLKQLAAANIKFVSMLAKNRIKGESVNEAKLKLTKDKKKKISNHIWTAPKRIMTKRAWLRMADYNKLRKNGVDYVMTNMDGKGVFLPVVFESVKESHTISFTKDEMALLHKDGQLKKDGHHYVYDESVNET